MPPGQHQTGYGRSNLVSVLLSGPPTCARGPGNLRPLLNDDSLKSKACAIFQDMDGSLSTSFNTRGTVFKLFGKNTHSRLESAAEGSAPPKAAPGVCG